MKFSSLERNHKAYVLCVIIVVLFFLGLLVDNQLKLKRMEKDYESQIDELTSLVQITNIGKTPELEFDVYQTVEKFLEYYYGISADVTADYRTEQLKGMMTEDAYDKYVTTDYTNSLNYSISISDVQIYVDYKNSNQNKVFVCVFYNENVDWPNINTITLEKYWLGVWGYDVVDEKWKLNEITACHELLTREEFDSFVIDTDASNLENENGGEKHEEARKEK